jgi:hypothetical protein
MISPKGNDDGTTILCLEVVTKLSVRKKERIEQLLRLCVTCLSIVQDLARVIHRSLNRIGLLFFFSLGDENHSNHINCGRDVV